MFLSSSRIDPYAFWPWNVDFLNLTSGHARSRSERGVSRWYCTSVDVSWRDEHSGTNSTSLQLFSIKSYWQRHTVTWWRHNATSDDLLSGNDATMRRGYQAWPIGLWFWVSWANLMCIKLLHFYHWLMMEMSRSWLFVTFPPRNVNFAAELTISIKNPLADIKQSEKHKSYISMSVLQTASFK